LIYLNSAPIDWYSKWQNTVKSSSFESDFIALRIVTKKLEAKISNDGYSYGWIG
jgi:hypothetical protein